MSTHTELLDLVRHSTLAVIEVPIELFLEDANLRDYLVKGKNCLSLNNMHIVENVCMCWEYYWEIVMKYEILYLWLRLVSEEKIPKLTN